MLHRAEFFGETEEGVGAIGVYDDGDASVFAATITGSYEIGNLTIKPEFRIDTASEDGTFVDSDLDPSKSLSSFVIAGIYKF